MEKGSSSSSSSSSSSAGPDSLNGLKFGKKIYFEGGAPPPEAALPPSPAKKGRTGAVQGGQPPRCQVEGCKLDLSDAKAYYSRHKVCGVHSKSPKVIVAGMEQRFCQQCSRFHQLPEFDQGKRSCRRRLAGHNERRRKPSPASLLSPRYGALFSLSIYDRTKTGAFVLDFSSCSSLTSQDSWSNPPPEREAPVTGKYKLPLQSNSHSPLSDLLQGTTPDRCFNGVSDSSSVLSLLSIQPWGSRPRPTSLGPTMAHPLVNHGPPIPQFAYNHDLGLGQTSRALDNPFAGELELGQPSEGDLNFDGLNHSRGYDTSLQHMHWSL